MASGTSVSRCGFVMCFAVLGSMWILAASAGRAVADQTVEATFGLGGEYNDNVRETRNGKGDFVSHVKPGLRYLYEAERVTAKFDYKGDYSYYMQGEAPDNYSHTLDARVLLELAEDRFFLDIAENLRPVYRQAARGDLVEGDTTRDQTDQNTFTVSPYFSFKPGERTSLKTGYRFSDIRYAEEAQPGSGSRKWVPGWSSGEASMNRNVRQQHELFGDLEHEASETVTMLAGYDLMRQEAEEQQDFYRHRPYVGASYEYAEKSTVRVKAGPMLTETDAGDRSARLYYSASLSHALDRKTLTLSSERDYTDDPETGRSILRDLNTAGISFQFDRSTLSATLGYAEYESSLQGGGNKFWRPGLNYTYELTDRLKANAGINAELDAGSTTSVTSDRYYANAGLNYELTESSWLALTYRYKMVDSSDDASSFTVNRVMIEWGMTF
ncbi:TIGR03016 family PEP-CTERM system-associated outer membrane protein [Desulfovibrio sp. DS-1]|nr:TIGR03016 family PEP-CTERM system-associated outer membrane protein [Nitratidesulfovibrio sp. SRB-5]RXF78483.1 TIGR03016 family PEP-CTERM system-associated outer membrane protein [Desulfovibrio sp. DS-1]